MANRENRLFVDGMHKDNEVSLQPPNTYRDAENMRLVSHDNNSFSLVSVRGNTVKFSLCNDGFVPIGWASFIEKSSNVRTLIVFSTDDETLTGGSAEIGIINIGPNTGLSTYQPVYYSDALLTFSKNHPIINESIALRENSDTKRVYWTDNFNQPRVLDLGKLPFIEPTTEIVDNNFYMVTCGTVRCTKGGSTDYGPGLPAGNIIDTVAVTGATYSALSADTLVVPYIREAELDFTPEKVTGKIENVFTFDTGGELLAGTYQYAYRLRLDSGYVSGWSYLSKPVPVGPDPMQILFNFSTYSNYQGDDNLVVTPKIVTLEINNIDETYDEIEIVAFRNTSQEVVEDGTIVVRTDITSDSMQFNHTGSENLGAILASELINPNVTVKKAKTITANNNILFMGNITEREELGDFDPSSATIEPFFYPMVSDIRGDLPDSAAPPFWGGLARGASLLSGEIRGGLGSFSGVYYQVTSGSITYDGVPISAPTVFQASVGVFTFTGGGTVVPLIRIKKYDNFGGGSTYQDTYPSNEFTDYKSPLYAEHLRGYMRGERYRIGFLPYDLEGNPMFVRWIGDIDMPEISDSAFGTTWELAQATTGGGADLDDAIFKIAGIKIDGLDITGIEDKISGFSIVRAKRDKQRIAQGILWPVVDDGSDDHPLLASRLDQDSNYVGTGRTLNTYIFHSPEHLFSISGGSDLDWQVVNDQDKFRLEAYLVSIHQGASVSGAIGRSVETTNHHYYQKLYDNASEPASSKARKSEQTITNNLNVAFGGTATGYFGGSRDFIQVATADTGATNESGVGISGREGRGALTSLVEIDGTETQTSGFGALLAADIAKPLCSLIRPAGSLYGGTGENALANTTYIYAGHYQEINASVLADVVDGSGNYIFDGIEIFGGDTFINIFDVSRIVKDNGAEDSGGTLQLSHTIAFPVESEINIAYREGRSVQRDGSFENEATGITNINGVAFTTSTGVPPGAVAAGAQPENFIYNSAYSADDNALLYPALPVGFVDDAEKINRLVYSPEKVLGEAIDSWRSFPANNLKDIEAINGEINNIRYKGNRMLYWQHGGVGFLSVNERVVVGDVLGAETRLGVGGVLDRYDERTRYYGNQNQHSLIELPAGFAWFDNVNKALCWMNVGGELIEMNTAKGLENFFEQVVVGSAVLTDNPILGEGISGVYDRNNKELLMTFNIENNSVPILTTLLVGDYYGYNGFNYKVTTQLTTGSVSLVDPGSYPNNFELIGPSQFTIGFLDTVRKFSGFYPFSPTTAVNVDGITLQATEGLKPTILNARSYVIGNQVSEGTDNYVAKTNFTSGDPATQPSSDTTNWEKVSDIEDVYEHDSGDICKFFGVVFDAHVEIVINPGREQFKTFDNYMHIGNDEMFTTLEYSNSYQSIIEANTDQIYQFLNRAWVYPTPLNSGDGRLRDYYLVIKAIKDNKDSDASIPIVTSGDNVIKLTSMHIAIRPSK